MVACRDKMIYRLDIRRTDNIQIKKLNNVYGGKQEMGRLHVFTY
jgi:hypothetical protein